MKMLAALRFCIAGLALTACAPMQMSTQNPPASAAPASSHESSHESSRKAAVELLRDGELTAEGRRKREAGLRLVAQDRNTDAYAEWLPLALAGHGESQYNMGLMTARGLGTAADAQASLQWMRQAAASGFPAAYLHLGKHHAGIQGAGRDDAEALRLFSRGAALGDAACALHAGDMLLNGLGEAPSEQGRARGIDLLMQAAQSDAPQARAQTLLGRFYLGSAHARPDHASALYWLEQAAAAEESEAQFHLGAMHHFGLGVTKNLHKALGWYLRSSQQGYGPAHNNIGLLYRNGDGVKKNHHIARAHFQQAQAKGSLDAAVNLGDMLFEGLGGARDRAGAAALYRTAAEAGHAWAQCRYAQVLSAGEGVARDPEEGARWLEKAQGAGARCKR